MVFFSKNLFLRLSRSGVISCRVTMGQRHQLFVIARINGKYRSLAAVHNQWLYGHTALRRCLSTLGIFQDSDNRVPIEAELTMASTKDEAFWTRPEGNERWPIDVKFPFIMTCLILGASFGAEEGYHRAVHAEPFHMAYDEGDNNNGITIFDISEPSSVRYCFVDFLGMESPREVQLMAPLTARIYLEAYYDLEDSDTKYLEGLVEDLAPYYLIVRTIHELTSVYDLRSIQLILSSFIILSTE